MKNLPRIIKLLEAANIIHRQGDDYALADEVQEQLAAQQKEKRKRRRWLFFWLFLLGMLLAGLMYWLGRRQSASNSPKVQNQGFYYANRYALDARLDSAGHLQYGYIDRKGDPLIAYQYDEAQPFDAYGFARVKIANHLYLIDTFNNRYPLAESVSSLSDTTLALSLKEQGLDSLPLAVLAHPQLRILYLRGNHLQQLPPTLAQHDQLEVIDLGYNDFSVAPKVLPQLSQLRILDLQHNAIGQIDSSIWNSRPLQILDLSYNKIKRIPKAIKKLQELRKLDLSNNQLHEVDEAVAELSALEELNLANNQLDSLPAAVEQKQALKINIAGNRMKVQGHNYSAWLKEKEEKAAVSDKESKHQANVHFQLSSDSIDGLDTSLSVKPSVLPITTNTTEGSLSSNIQLLDCSQVFKTKRFRKKNHILLTHRLPFCQEEQQQWFVQFFSNKKTTLINLGCTARNGATIRQFDKGTEVGFEDIDGQIHYYPIAQQKNLRKGGKQQQLLAIPISKNQLSQLSASPIIQLHFKGVQTTLALPVAKKQVDQLNLYLGCFTNNVLYQKDNNLAGGLREEDCRQFMENHLKTKVLFLNKEANYRYSLSLQMAYDGRLKGYLYYKDALPPKLDEKDWYDTEISFMNADSSDLLTTIVKIDAVKFGGTQLYQIDLVFNGDSVLQKLGAAPLTTVNVKYSEALKTYIRYIPPKAATQLQVVSNCLWNRRKKQMLR